MEKIIELLKNYSKKDADLFHDTIDMLCAKGIANGSYQDYGVLMDILSILTIVEDSIRRKE